VPLPSSETVSSASLVTSGSFSSSTFSSSSTVDSSSGSGFKVSVEGEDSSFSSFFVPIFFALFFFSCSTCKPESQHQGLLEQNKPWDGCFGIAYTFLSCRNLLFLLCVCVCHCLEVNGVSAVWFGASAELNLGQLSSC